MATQVQCGLVLLLVNCVCARTRLLLTVGFPVQSTPISYLIWIAEQRKKEAQYAMDVGDPEGHEQFRQWSVMLDTLLRVKNGLAGWITSAVDVN